MNLLVHPGCQSTATVPIAQPELASRRIETEPAKGSCVEAALEQLHIQGSFDQCGCLIEWHPGESQMEAERGHGSVADTAPVGCRGSIRGNLRHQAARTPRSSGAHLAQGERHAGLAAHAGRLQHWVAGLQSIHGPKGSEPARYQNCRAETLPEAGVVVGVVAPRHRSFQYRADRLVQRAAQLACGAVSGIDRERGTGLTSRFPYLALPVIDLSTPREGVHVPRVMP